MSAETVNKVWFSVGDLAERLGVSTHVVERLLLRQEILGKKIGRDWRVHAEAVADYESDGIPKGRQQRPRFAVCPDVVGKRRRAKEAT